MTKKHEQKKKRQTGLLQNEKLVYIKGHYHRCEKAVYKMEENISSYKCSSGQVCKLYEESDNSIAPLGA